MITEERIRELFIVVCFYGKRITDLMPRLPKHMKPRHINIIEIIHRLTLLSGSVCISDVSTELGITTPSITKLINELEEYDIVKKTSGTDDKRITTVKLTTLGETYYEVYVKQYHGKLVKLLKDVDEKDVETVMRTMEYIYRTMLENPVDLDHGERYGERTGTDKK